MRRRRFIAASIVAPSTAIFAEEEASDAAIVIELNAGVPSASQGRIVSTGLTFPVGFGKQGYLPAGDSFQGGFSLLGTFSVNAILAMDRFEMIDELVSESGKSRAWLEANLFRNMSSIDFDGDGAGGEYGAAFIGLAPVGNTARQPFHFGEYKGVFRWYSYALHGTQDEDRIGKCVTGGCINVAKTDLANVVEMIRLGDTIQIESS